MDRTGPHVSLVSDSCTSNLTQAAETSCKSVLVLVLLDKYTLSDIFPVQELGFAALVAGMGEKKSIRVRMAILSSFFFFFSHAVVSVLSQLQRAHGASQSKKNKANKNKADQTRNAYMAVNNRIVINPRIIINLNCDPRTVINSNCEITVGDSHSPLFFFAECCNHEIYYKE